MKGTTGTYEVRVEVGSDIYRVFSFFDEGKLKILVNGFQKKSQKTPKSQIELTEKLNKQYFDEKKENNKLTSVADHLDMQYGILDTKERDELEAGFESFKLGVMLQELRKEQGMTQEQPAEKSGTTKTYISRIENDASDIRLSTLTRIICEGLGKHLRLSVEE